MKFVLKLLTLIFAIVLYNCSYINRPKEKTASKSKKYFQDLKKEYIVAIDIDNEIKDIGKAVFTIENLNNEYESTEKSDKKEVNNTENPNDQKNPPPVRKTYSPNYIAGIQLKFGVNYDSAKMDLIAIKTPSSDGKGVDVILPFRFFGEWNWSNPEREKRIIFANIVMGKAVYSFKMRFDCITDIEQNELVLLLNSSTSKNQREVKFLKQLANQDALSYVSHLEAIDVASKSTNEKEAQIQTLKKKIEDQNTALTNTENEAKTAKQTLDDLLNKQQELIKAGDNLKSNQSSLVSNKNTSEQKIKDYSQGIQNKESIINKWKQDALDKSKEFEQLATNLKNFATYSTDGNVINEIIKTFKTYSQSNYAIANSIAKNIQNIAVQG